MFCSSIQVIICTERTRWNCCPHVSSFILYILPSKAQCDNACSPFIVFYTNGPPLSTSRTGLLHDCPWQRVNKPWPHTHTPPSVCSVVSNRSTGRQHSAVLVLSSARGPNNIEFSSPGIHKHTVSIILPQAQHHISHHNQIFVPAVRDAIKFCQVRRAGTHPASH